MPQSDKKRNPVAPGDVARNTLIVLGILVIAIFLWVIKDALLVAFAGVILAVILTGFARQLRRLVPISRPWSLATVGVVIILFVGLFSFILGSQIVNEFEALTEQLPRQISELKETVRGWPLGEYLLGESEDRQGDNGDDNQDENGDSDNEGGLGETMVGDAGGIIFQVGTTIVSVFSTLILIFGTGIFFAINPDIYKKGIALLFTEKRADRVNEALETSGKALWQWLTGQFMAMAFVGIAATIGLMIIGVPLALILGIIAGLSDFVPIVGPLAASILAILLAFSISPETALYTAILYIVIQQFESNLVTPLVQRRMVHIPPAVVILSLVAFGSVFGIAGVILATPLTVVAMVFVGMFYVQDVLGKEVTVPGKD